MLSRFIQFPDLRKDGVSDFVDGDFYVIPARIALHKTFHQRTRVLLLVHIQRPSTVAPSPHLTTAILKVIGTQRIDTVVAAPD